jgi:hypothetical protein
MSHGVRHDLEAVLDRALDELLAKLEKERVGDGVPRAVRREVFDRHGEQCTFTTADARASSYGRSLADGLSCAECIVFACEEP